MLWTKEHLYTLIPTFIIEIILSIILGKALKNKSDKVKMIPITVVTVILLVLEVLKQLNGIINGYDLYRLPFHFCSLFLYFLPLASFYYGKYKNEARILASTISTCLFLFMVVYPNLIYSGDAIKSAINYIKGDGGSFIDFHSVLFHTLALFEFFLFSALDVCKLESKKDLKLILIAFIIYCVIVGPLSQIIKTNFNNFYHSNVPPIEDIRLNLLSKISWPAQLIYVSIISVGTVLVPIGAYFIMKGSKKLYSKII